MTERHAENMADKLENLLIGIGMNWDTDGLFDDARLALDQFRAAPGERDNEYERQHPEFFT